ncbi:TPA: TauD/TfdA family dioxygenase [Stenotrophomonas maltophilia]|jgi:hypothetical protein|uniref:TauD/TfdA family dioxygenase n=1 Tax=Stenotrophomonas maltophilia TaxID=40324 RepID=UPI001FA766A3|nr:TauD/TfdA family dioxygenase [Stenotrophomonas maltophilia]HDS1098151.1 TauD/TfdA family dioxygenase [Stenotrophomonas maltophilia]
MSSWQRQLQDVGFAKTKISKNFELTEVEQTLGNIDQIYGVEPIQELVPRVGVGMGPSYSHNFGLGVFPFHTDMAHWSIPPRYFALICIVGSRDVKTNIVHRDSLIDPQERDFFKKAILRSRRPLDGRQVPLRMVDGDIFRWDTLFLQPVNSIAVRAVRMINDRIRDVSISSVALDEPDQVLVVDNWRTLHGRSEVSSSSRGRVLKRVYLE